MTFTVPDGAEFVPRLFAELGVADPVGQRLAARRSTTSSCRYTGIDDPRRRGGSDNEHATAR